eukprot:11916745-Ditylum_brightwellii.AAC.1
MAIINDSKKKEGNQLSAPICLIWRRIWAVCEGCDDAFSDSQPHTVHKSVKRGCFLCVMIGSWLSTIMAHFYGYPWFNKKGIGLFPGASLVF